MEIERIDVILQKDCHLDKLRKVIIGVSGGPDSLCLLDLIVRLGYPVVVAHFHHRLREEAEGEAEQVARTARAMGLPFGLGSLDVAAMSAAEGLSLEEAARIARYRFLFETAREQGAQAVMVGHTADDQVETVLMHLLRGAGLSGLKGMSLCAALPEWDRQIPLVRPLLSVWREETLAYCKERGLNPIFDPSNQDTTYFRNRLRHELIPFLETYNPRVRQALLRTSQALAGDAEIIGESVAQAWAICRAGAGERFIAFDAAQLKALSTGMQRQVIRQAIETLRPALRNIDFDDVELAVSLLIDPPRTRQADLARGLRLYWEDDRLYLLEWEAVLPTSDRPQVDPSEPRRIDVPGWVALEGGWEIRAETNEGAGGNGRKAPFGKDEAWLDADRLSLPLVVRGRRAGDRFRPFGQGGHSIKISDFYVNEKLPRRYREAWPLVCSGDEIVWIAGYRPAEPYAMTAKTRTAVRLCLVRRENPV